MELKIIPVENELSEVTKKYQTEQKFLNLSLESSPQIQIENRAGMSTRLIFDCS